MKGTFNFDFDQKSLNNFEAQCEVAIRNLGRGTKKPQLLHARKFLKTARLRYLKIPTHY